jgi:copper chaperone CopZ/cytochrome c biogenesis protein CcdA
MKRVVYSVPNINCDRCAQTISRGLRSVAGVHEIQVDVPGRAVAVTYDPESVSSTTIRERLETTGFPAGEQAVEELIPTSMVTEKAAPARTILAANGQQRYWLLVAGVLLLALAGYSGYVLYPRFGLPAVEGASLLLLASGAGIASFFSPCSFPLLVTLLTRQPGVQRGAARERLGFGQALTFATALSLGAAIFLILGGLVIALGGEALFAGVVFTSPAGRIIRTVVGLALIVLGLMQAGILPLSLHAVEHISRPLMRSQAHYRRQNPFLGFTIFGFGYLLAGFG